MEDYREKKSTSSRQIRQDIQSLQARLKASHNSLQQRKIIDEISKLEQERLHDANLFVDDDVDIEEDEISGEEFPILDHVRTIYDKIVAKNSDQNRDVLGLLLYLRYFDQEFLGFLTPRKLKLDVKYSMVRDTFYNLYNQVDRNLTGYLGESDRIKEGDYTKKYEQDILKRLVEMRNGLFIEADKFFRRLRQFADDLLEDLAENQILCQNGNEYLSYNTIDSETVLRALTVKEALEKMYDLAEEAVQFLDVPDFQR
jgi:hypothetical protein